MPPQAFGPTKDPTRPDPQNRQLSTLSEMDVCVCVCVCLPAYECHMAEEVEPLWTLDFGRSHKVCSRGSKTLLHQFQLSLAPNNVAMLQSKPKGTNQCG